MEISFSLKITKYNFYSFQLVFISRKSILVFNYFFIFLWIFKGEYKLFYEEKMKNQICIAEAFFNHNYKVNTWILNFWSLQIVHTINHKYLFSWEKRMFYFKFLCKFFLAQRSTGRRKNKFKYLNIKMFMIKWLFSKICVGNNYKPPITLFFHLNKVHGLLHN